MFASIISVGAGAWKNDKASHYGTLGVVVVSPKASSMPFSRPGALARPVLTIGCSGADAPAGYSPLS